VGFDPGLINPAFLAWLHNGHVGRVSVTGPEVKKWSAKERRDYTAAKFGSGPGLPEAAQALSAASAKVPGVAALISHVQAQGAHARALLAAKSKAAIRENHFFKARKQAAFLQFWRCFLRGTHVSGEPIAHYPLEDDGRPMQPVIFWGTGYTGGHVSQLRAALETVLGEERARCLKAGLPFEAEVVDTQEHRTSKTCSFKKPDGTYCGCVLAGVLDPRPGHGLRKKQAQAQASKAKGRKSYHRSAVIRGLRHCPQ